ncbi:MAG: trimethylamine methyltransferase family protein [Alphaproteobacteria bacterium]|jgi:trimethylamine--corrinoid protein Co-methyltransferase|nr:trimethylamine methyltransferase family protein [Alphaproteobacteria bacterium]MDP6815519.1 trimethylamine methyltransferase family protein [Alphaproteobacteria bacterium]
MARPARSRGGRRRRQGGAAGLRQLPFQRLRYPYQPFEILSADEIEGIHQASMDVLERIGINFHLDEAREILQAAGAEIRPGDPRVRLDRDLLAELVAKAPARFRSHARNPDHDLDYGGDNANFALIASTPNVSDLEGGRRSGNFADYQDLIRLGQSLNIVHQIGGYPVEPIDLHPSIRHLEAERAMLKLSDKVGHGYSLGRERIRDSIEMVRIARGVDHERLLTEPSLLSVINANSPLQYDRPMLLGIIEMASHGQPVIITPFTLAGAMAPVTLAGALVQQNAEALAGIAFAQAVRPGAPVFYGGFTSNVDMKTGSPAFGTPEYAKTVLIGGQLARRYGVPYRSSNVNASNAPDVQSAYESQMSLWPCILAQCHLMKHALGWLEGGLCASFEKVIIDAEMLQMMAEFLRPVMINDDETALSAMQEVGPGGHYFGCAHTMERYETAFYAPMLSDWRNFETWSEAGAVDATRRAHGVYRQILADYQPPPMDPAIAEELDDYVDRRIAEGGVPTDF